jgi:hypothetical protein
MILRLKDIRKWINLGEDSLELERIPLGDFRARRLADNLSKRSPSPGLEPALRQHLNFNSRGLIFASIHSLGSFLEIGRLGVRDIFENLRIPIDQRKP